MKKMQINWHRRTGTRPGFSVHREQYGTSTVFVLRMWWAALTLTRVHTDKSSF